MSSGPKTNFKILGLSPDANWDEVRSAFRRLARTYHPDIAGPEGTRRFTEITEAYMTLKETLSPGVAGESRRSSPSGSVVREETEDGASWLWRLWEKIAAFFRGDGAAEYAHETGEGEIPPVRVRFIGSILSRAETDLLNLTARRAERKNRSKTEDIVRRLRSRHPEVVLLALKKLSARDAAGDVKAALEEHFAEGVPTSEVLEGILSLLSASPAASGFARMLASRAKEYSAHDAQAVLKWFRLHKIPKECYAAFLSHPLNSVIAATLNRWPSSETLIDVPDVVSLLRSDDENILIPLLRIIKKEKLPIWVIGVITKLASEYPSPAVRVWASAIVRERNLG